MGGGAPLIKRNKKFKYEIRYLRTRHKVSAMLAVSQILNSSSLATRDQLLAPDKPGCSD